jgi:hypothetical protein
VTAFDVMPDAEAVTGKLIRDNVSGSRVYSSIPKRPEYPLVLVRRYGGVPVTRMRLDAADIQIDVYGTSKSEARLLASQVRAALLEQGETGASVTVSSGNAYVTGITQIMGLTWMPDPSNVPTNRYVFSVRVFLHAA